MPTNWTGTWDGGRTYQTGDGETVFVIRRMVESVRYEHPLLGIDGPLDERKAKAQLALFEQDPVAYRAPQRLRLEKKQAAEVARVQEDLEAVRLVEDTAARYLEAIKDRTERYRIDTRRYLAAWADALEGRDLRKVTPRDMLKLLSGWKKARQKRIAAIKAFCSWLIKTGQLDPAQDPSRSLTVPAAKPQKDMREKGYEMEFVERLYAATAEQAVRDVLCLRAKTGMHDTEIRRLALGEGALTPVKHPAIKGTIKFPHKGGRPHTISVDAKTFAAAGRLQRLGENAPTADRVRWALGSAAQTAGLLKKGKKEERSKRPPRINLSELRHSFVAWSLERGKAVTVSGDGVPLALVTAVLGHTNTVTTRKFYDVSKYPAMIDLPIRLEHPDDPPIIKQGV